MDIDLPKFTVLFHASLCIVCSLQLEPRCHHLPAQGFALIGIQAPCTDTNRPQVSAIFFPWVMGDTWVTKAHGSWVIHLLYSGAVQPMTHGSQTVVQPVTHGELAAHRPWAVQ